MAREYIPVALRRLVFRRARRLCEYCRAPADISSSPFCIEHIQPDAREGTSDETNLALSCPFCKLSKGVRTQALDPSTGLQVKLFNPSSSAWEAHFCWSEDFLIVIGLTPTGRATIEALKLNRPELQSLRETLKLSFWKTSARLNDKNNGSE